MSEIPVDPNLGWNCVGFEHDSQVPEHMQRTVNLQIFSDAYRPTRLRNMFKPHLLELTHGCILVFPVAKPFSARCLAIKPKWDG